MKDLEAPLPAAEPVAWPLAFDSPREGAAAAGAPAEVRRVDFATPPPLDLAVRALVERVHERHALLLATSLSSYLGGEVRVSLRSAEPLRLESWCERLAPPAACALARLAPLGIPVVLEFAPATLLAMVERLLGGSGRFDAAPRPLTGLELRILEQVARRSAEALAAAFPGAAGAELVAIESDPQALGLAGPGENVVQVALEVGLGQGSGPASVTYRLADLRPRTAPPAPAAAPAAMPPGGGRLERVLAGASVPLRIELGSARLRLDEVDGLRPGDVIRLDRRASEEVEVRIGDRVHFRGEPGRVAARRAVRITRHVEEE